MVCPICNTEYSSLNPCGCDTVGFAPLPEREQHPAEPEMETKAPALQPTGIGDPFWH